jgi:hypothetical protein
MLAVQVISAVNGPALEKQSRLVVAAKEAGTIKQFFPSEFSCFGAVGESWLGPALSRSNLLALKSL